MAPEPPEFQGFPARVFEWFAGLERDNSREYFADTRERYEFEVRGGLEALLAELQEEFGSEPRMFRQQRDLRFSADKSPYKTRTYGVCTAGPAPAAACTPTCRRAACTPAPATTGWPATSWSASAPPSPTTRPAPGSKARRRRPRPPGSRCPAGACARRRAGTGAITRGSSCCAGPRSSPAARCPAGPAWRATPRSLTSPARGARQRRSTRGSTRTWGRARSRRSRADDGADARRPRVPPPPRRAGAQGWARGRRGNTGCR